MRKKRTRDQGAGNKKRAGGAALVAGILALPLLAAAGCTALQSNAPPAAIYRLEVRTQAPPVAQDASGILRIASPDLPPGFSGRNIVLFFESGRRQDYYAGAEWAGNLEDMIAAFIGRMARDAYPGMVVETTRGPLPAAYVLRADILDFQPEYAAGPGDIPAVRVKIRFTLQAGRQAVLSDFTVARTVVPAENSMTAIAAALETGLRDAVYEALSMIAPALTAPAMTPSPGKAPGKDGAAKGKTKH